MAKPRKTSYAIISPTERPEMYELLRELVKTYHDHLLNAQISLAWCYSWKPDKDGHLILGKCKKAADLDRQLHDRDFIILLNEEVWTSVEFDDRKRRALLDHELCHADVEIDSDGETVFNAAGRTVYRTRKHDLEEFRCIVERHGCWIGDIEEFARAALRQGRTPLFVGDGVDSVTISSGGKSATLSRRALAASSPDIH